VTSRVEAPGGALSDIWSDVDAVAAFGRDYAEARTKFRAAANAPGLAIETHQHPTHQGPGGETLAVDVAVLGPATAPAALLLTSATHGVEGFCGSGCQAALLRDAFFVDTPAWKAMVVGQARATALQALVGLATREGS
jgi:hypothetical protein